MHIHRAIDVSSHYGKGSQANRWLLASLDPAFVLERLRLAGGPPPLKESA